MGHTQNLCKHLVMKDEDFPTNLINSNRQLELVFEETRRNEKMKED